jgi:DNA gyrase/topoisomerase IV subunit B
MEFGYLHERLAALPFERPVTIQCIQVAETLAEKVLSLLRRCAWNWGGHQGDEMDAALVRHVYDVHRIMESRPKELGAAEDIFESLVMGDTLEFAGRDPEFDAYPKETLKKTLTRARDSTVLQQQYVERLLPLIYDGDPVPYAVAFAGFEAAASSLIAKL